MTGLRGICAPFVVAPRTGVSTKDRLRPTSEEAEVLAVVGEFLGGLYRTDYAARAAEGRLDAQGRARSRRERKRVLTGVTSSRWAGAITRRSEDQWALGMRTLYDHRAGLRAALATLDDRLALAPGETTTGTRGKRVRGYRDKSEWFAKTRRRAILTDRLARVEARIEAALPRVVHGSSRLWRNRQHLAQANLTEQLWRERWDASRWFLTADGETGKRCGNETIRVDADGYVIIKIPAALAGKYGTHVRLSVPLNLTTHRAGEWADRINTNRAVGYRIALDPDKNRWYLHASWTHPQAKQPTLAGLRQSRTLAVDVNGDHLAAWVIDPAGNPVAAPLTIPLTVEGPATTRDAHLRHGITRLVHAARRHGCASVSIENLNFRDARATGRETMGRARKGKQFRRTVAGIPTGQFRNRLVAMAAEHGPRTLGQTPGCGDPPRDSGHEAAHPHTADRPDPQARHQRHPTAPPQGTKPDRESRRQYGCRRPTPFGANRAGLIPAHYLGTVRCLLTMPTPSPLSPISR